jgi:hypothetical protein
MIENGLGFQLRALATSPRKNGSASNVSGLQRDDGGIEWSFRRKRRLAL